MPVKEEEEEDGWAMWHVRWTGEMQTEIWYVYPELKKPIHKP